MNAYNLAIALSVMGHLEREEMSEWQDISTAPKDGSYVILYRPTAPEWQKVSEGRWDTQSNHKKPRPYWSSPWRIAYNDGDRANDPTHWMPRPTPPKDNTK